MTARPVCFTLLVGTLLAASAVQTPAVAQNTENVPAETENVRCLETDSIESYKVESDERIRFVMKDGLHYLMRLNRHCPQLYFHRYISYTPVNGKICAGPDEIKTRAGLSCRIDSFERIPDATPTLQQAKTKQDTP